MKKIPHAAQVILENDIENIISKYKLKFYLMEKIRNQRTQGVTYYLFIYSSSKVIKFYLEKTAKRHTRDTTKEIILFNDTDAISLDAFEPRFKSYFSESL